MAQNDFLEKLKVSLESAGFQIMSDAELQAWLDDGKRYRESVQGQADETLRSAHLAYCIDHAKYKFTPEMGEISGFGGGYESTCRIMLDAGLRWLDDHPDAEPKFMGNSQVYGLILEDNEEAKALSEAVVAAASGDCTGAMHQAVITSCLWIRKNGWDTYVQKMSEKEGAA